MRLFSPLQISGAAFFGGWLGGFLTMALNFARMKKVGAALGSLLVGLIVTVGWCKLATTVSTIVELMKLGQRHVRDGPVADTRWQLASCAD